MPALAQELFAPDMTVAQARRALTEAFRQAELDSPELDARLLVGHALGLDHTALTIESGRSLGGDAAQALTMLAARRLKCEPVARILGTKEFWGLPLRLNDATLVPRPETETVVEAALAAIESAGPRSRALQSLISALAMRADRATHRVAECVRHRHRCGAATRLLPREKRRLSVAAREFAVCDFGATLTGLRPRGQQPALYRERRHRHASLSAATRAARSMAAPTASTAIAHCGTGAETALNDDLVVSLASVRNAVATLFRAAGLRPSPARPDLAGIPRALPARVATMTP